MAMKIGRRICRFVFIKDLLKNEIGSKKRSINKQISDEKKVRIEFMDAVSLSHS